MTSTSSTTLRRRRLVAAALAIPLSLGMTGAAFATGPADGSTGALRTAGASDQAAQNAAAVSAAARVAADKAAVEKAAEKAAEQAAAERAAARAAADKAAADKAAETAAARAAEKAAAKDDRPATGSAAGAVSGQSAAAATSTNTSYVNGNTNSSKADRPNAPVTKSAAPSQPLSNADKTGKGANVGTAENCAKTNPYCSNDTGVEPGNGNDSAPAKGQPCAGCVGKADNKNPKGQAPGGSDRNAGYECDRNQGIGQMNPAHTGCTSPAPQPTATKTPPATKTPTPKPTKTSTPTPTKTPGTAVVTVKVDCRTVVVTSSKDISNVVVFFKDGTSQKFDGLSGKTWTRTFTKDLASAIAKSAKSTATGTATGCGVLPTGTPTPTATACPSGSSMPGNGNGNGNGKGKPCKDDDDDDRKVSICHATGSATNPYVLIEISEKALKEHREHQDRRDIIPAPAGGCPGAASEDKITICHATGNAVSPYVIVTVNRKDLDGHGGHAGDIIPAPAGGTCPGGTTTFDQCPNMPGLQPAGTSCTQPPITSTLFCPDGSVMPAGDPANCPVPPRDVCPNQDGIQLMGPCNNGGGGGGGNGGGGGSPISGVTPNQPATGPVTGPPTTVPPVIVPNGNRPPTLIGTVTTPATRPAATRPRALPFTGTEMVLLAQLGAFLLLAGGGALLLARRERTARAR